MDIIKTNLSGHNGHQLSKPLLNIFGLSHQDCHRHHLDDRYRSYIKPIIETTQTTNLKQWSPWTLVVKAIMHVTINNAIMDTTYITVTKAAYTMMIDLTRLRWLDMF
jgi:hypothetical protein